MLEHYRLLTAAFVMAWAAPLAARADTNTDVGRCAAEPNSVKRLECFDSLSRKLGVSSPKTITAAISKWKIEKETSRLDDKTNVTVSLKAESPIEGWPKKSYTPWLMLRCKEHKTDVFIITGMPPNVEYGNTEGATVTLRFDKEKAAKYRTYKSTDGEALFFPQSAGMIKKMLPHKTMLFEFIPFNSSPVMTTFDLSGMDEAVKPLRDTCK